VLVDYPEHSAARPGTEIFRNLTPPTNGILYLDAGTAQFDKRRSDEVVPRA
jgi:hypothetical protein